jgi:glycerophosphoryl diester phosphodiesterase
MRSPLLSAMRFVGHRGASHIAPENTMAAFRAATARGVGFECDLQSMRDGTLLVLHDDTLLRTATAPPDLTDAAARRFRELVRTPVGELDYADVCDVDVGSWMNPKFASERPPRFDEALLMKAPDVFAELKGDIDPDLVGALEIPETLTWISFSLPLVAELKRRDSTQPCLHVAEPRNLEDAWAAARAVVNSDVDGVDLPASPELVTPELVDYLHDHDKRVAVWVWRAPASNDTPAVWDALSKAGVDAFTSNLPPELIL